jgi:hypothetical protein
MQRGRDFWKRGYRISGGFYIRGHCVQSRPSLLCGASLLIAGSSSALTRIHAIHRGTGGPSSRFRVSHPPSRFALAIFSTAFRLRVRLALTVRRGGDSHEIYRCKGPARSWRKRARMWTCGGAKRDSAIFGLLAGAIEAPIAAAMKSRSSASVRWSLLLLILTVVSCAGLPSSRSAIC